MISEAIGKPNHEGRRDAGLKGKSRCSITSLANFCTVNGLTMVVDGAKDTVEIFYEKKEPEELTPPLPDEFTGDPEEDEPPF